MNKYERITKKYLKKLKSKHNFNKKRIFTIFDFVFLACFLVVLIMGGCFSFKINRLLNNITLEQSKKITNNQGVIMHVLDVGQAECVVVELPDGKIVVYDSGLEENGNYIVKYIKKLTNSNIIDLFILSHTDGDHIGGALHILDKFNVKNIIRPIVKSSHENFKEQSLINGEYTFIYDKNYAKVLNKIYVEGANVWTAEFNNVSILNSTFDAPNYDIDFYFPSFKTSSQLNDFSSVVTIKHGAKTLMITGDATERTERYLLNEYSLPDIDFLVVAHHGSNTSSSLEFLQKVRPSYAYISVSSTNSYGHPDQNVINRLLYVGVLKSRIYKTSECNDIVLAFGKAGVQNYFEAFEIKYIYLAIGLILVVFVVYFKKTKKLTILICNLCVEKTEKRKREKNNKLI